MVDGMRGGAKVRPEGTAGTGRSLLRPFQAVYRQPQNNDFFLLSIFPIPENNTFLAAENVSGQLPKTKQPVLIS